MNFVELSLWQVGFATLLVVINGGLSLWLRLGLGVRLLLASLRTVVQLLLIGLILEWVFELERWYSVIALSSFMTIVAGLTAASRPAYRFSGMTIRTLLSIGVSSWILTGYAIVIVMGRKEDWYHAQFIIPILGMLLGNMLNGTALGLENYLNALTTKRADVEELLALGATRLEATHHELSNALRVAMIPIINSMTVVGLVSLPGMMTGQLLAGAPPADAVRYQIIIMFLIASATALGAASAILLAFFRLFSSDHCLLYDDIEQR